MLPLPFKKNSFAFSPASLSPLFAPWLVIFIVVLPQLAMLALAFWDYGILKHILDSKEKNILTNFGLALAILLLLTLLVSIKFTYKRKALPFVWTPLWLLGAYGFWTFFFLYAQGGIEWWKIPAWMTETDNVYIYPATFISPTIFLGILQFVYILTPQGLDDRHILWNFGLGLLMPLFVYLGFQFIDLLLSSNIKNARVVNYIAYLFFLGASLLFFFFLLRSFLLLARASFFQAPKAASIRQIFLRYLLPTFLLLFPQLGLLFNNHGELIGLANFTYIFGDFSHPSFYLFAFANSLLLVLPTPARWDLRIALFLGRLSLLPFSLYFLIVFLPWLPLALLAILLAGFGFLVLTPLLVFYFHSKALWEDLRFFRKEGLLEKPKTRRRLFAAAMALLSILPASIYLDYTRDRLSLRYALDYVYAPDYGDADLVEKIDRKRLLETLKRIRFFNQKSQTPYLDRLYRSIVLDDLTLQEKKIDTLERIFFGKLSPSKKAPKNVGPLGSNTTRLQRLARRRPPRENGVLLQELHVHSRLSEDQSHQISQVEFTVKNFKKGPRQFHMHFFLPEDVFVKNHYLVMDGRREYGILAEKKSALWVYHRIVSQRRDPSILYYKNSRELVLKIFPVEENKTRVAGFTLLHRRAFSINFAGKNIKRKLHFSAPTALQKRYLPKLPQKSLRLTSPSHSQVYLKVILDCSKDNPNQELYLDFLSHLQKNIKPKNKQETKESLRTYCVNFRTRAITPKDMIHKQDENRPRHWKPKHQDIPYRSVSMGGFFLGRALSQIFFQTHQENEAQRKAAQKKGQVFVRSLPRILVFGPFPSKEQSIFVERHHSFRWIFGQETRLYYISFQPDKGFAFQQYNFLEDEPFKRKYKKISFVSKRKALQKLSLFVGKDAKKTLPALPRSAVYQSPEEIIESLPEKTSTTDYEKGLYGLALHRRLQLQPSSPALRMALLSQGFQSKILNPALASLALENEAQKEVLRRKQTQILSGHRGLDLEEEPPPMDEPSFFWLLVFLLVFFLYRRRLFLQKKWKDLLARL